MTSKDISRLTEVAEKATPGPWMDIHDKIRGDHDKDGWTVIALTPCPRSPVTFARQQQWRRDAAYIATFDPPTVLALLAENRSQAERLREVEGALKVCLQFIGNEHHSAQAEALEDRPISKDARDVWDRGWAILYNSTPPFRMGES